MPGPAEQLATMTTTANMAVTEGISPVRAMLAPSLSASEMPIALESRLAFTSQTSLWRRP
jgi:hypothetical protein